MESCVRHKTFKKAGVAPDEALGQNEAAWAALDGLGRWYWLVATTPPTCFMVPLPLTAAVFWGMNASRFWR